MNRQHIVFLTGAGISVESGLSTFRGKEGMWNNKDGYIMPAWKGCITSLRTSWISIIGVGKNFLKLNRIKRIA